MRKIPPLLYTTKEGRRVYKFLAIVKKRKLTEIHIDPHYEAGHGSYMNDEKIYNFAWELEKGERVKLEKRKNDWEYYSYLTWVDWRAYEMSWC